MTIISKTIGSVGQVGVVPRRIQMVVTDSLSVVTTANYLQADHLYPDTIQPTDIVDMYYGATNLNAPGTYGEFLISITAGVITLVQAEGSVALPTIVNHIAVYNSTSGGLGEDAATAINGGNIQAGLSGTAGYVASFPATAAKGSLRLTAVANTGDTLVTISNAAMGQASVVSLPDPGASTAKFLLDTGTGATATITKISTGATPVPMVDPGSCTIAAVAGASNTATVTIQLKDGAGTNIARSVRFSVYSSSAADGLTLQSAASTGYSVASGGLSLQNGAAITTQITAMSSASGACVLSLLDTGKQTSYLVLVLPSGNKISAQLSAGSYGA